MENYETKFPNCDKCIKLFQVFPVLRSLVKNIAQIFKYFAQQGRYLQAHLTQAQQGTVSRDKLATGTKKIQSLETLMTQHKQSIVPRDTYDSAWHGTYWRIIQVLREFWPYFVRLTFIQIASGPFKSFFAQQCSAVATSFYTES